MPLDLTPFAHKPDFTVYQTPAWIDPLRHAMPHLKDASRIVSLPDGRRVLFSALQTDQMGAWAFVEALPFALFGGPVVEDGNLSADDVRYLWTVFQKGMGLLSINLDPLHPIATPALLGSWAQPLTTHLLTLAPNFESVEQHFTKTVRYDVRSAITKGVQVRNGKGLADFETYYQLSLIAASKRGSNTGHFPKNLFQAFANVPGNDVSLWLADYEDKVIGALLFIHYGVGRCIYWGSAMHPEYTRLNPTKLLLREAIRTACERGDTLLNMGPSVGFAGETLDGVRQLKESFGGRPHDYAVAIHTNLWALRFRGLRNRLTGLLNGGH